MKSNVEIIHVIDDYAESRSMHLRHGRDVKYGYFYRITLQRVSEPIKKAGIAHN